jgi:hypothetical protein
MVYFRALLLPFAIMAICLPVYGDPAQNVGAKINLEALDWARTLIAQGRFVADKNGAWRKDRPSRSQENDFIRDNGFQEYAKWFLAVDRIHSPNSKARCKFPFGDFRNVHRCGLLAAKSRAREFGYHEIESAAAKLLEAIDHSSHPLKNVSTNSGRSSL